MPAILSETPERIAFRLQEKAVREAHLPGWKKSGALCVSCTPDSGYRLGQKSVKVEELGVGPVEAEWKYGLIAVRFPVAVLKEFLEREVALRQAKGESVDLRGMS